MISSASQDTSQPPSSYGGGSGVFYTLGKYAQTLVLLMLSINFVINGASVLGLVGPAAHIDASQHAHWRAAVFLVLGGGLLAAALFTLVAKFNQKAA